MALTIEILHSYFFAGAASLFIFQSAVLFARGKNNQVRTTMAVQELLWGLMYLFTLYLMHSVYPEEEYSLFREKVLVLGSYFISFMVVFLTQVLIPGWLNWKRLFLLESPIVFMTIVYYGVMFLLGETPEHLFSYSVLIDSIGHFNVWFRFVFCFVNIVYVVSLLKWLHGYELKYLVWKNENYSDQDYVDISWMRSYYYIIVGITLFYFGMLIFRGHLPILLHCSFVILSFSYLFYKILFYESPYPADFFATLDEKIRKREADDIYVLSGTAAEVEGNSEIEQTFEMRIPEYIDLLKKWMEDEKPYLYKDFKLTDVSRVLPLNRSYLSRVFNEGFGKNFNEVVRSYRIEYSIEVLMKQSALPLHRVAELCGFSSDSTFIRAFKQVTGMTPNQYKNKE